LAGGIVGAERQRQVDHVSFNGAFDAPPLVVASLASYNGNGASSPRIGSVSATKFTAMAPEHQSYDLETNHGYEIVDWMAFSSAARSTRPPPSRRPPSPWCRRDLRPAWPKPALSRRAINW
jgi:hypothetical protein